MWMSDIRVFFVSLYTTFFDSEWCRSLVWPPACCFKKFYELTKLGVFAITVWIVTEKTTYVGYFPDVRWNSRCTLTLSAINRKGYFRGSHVWLWVLIPVKLLVFWGLLCQLLDFIWWAHQHGDNSLEITGRFYEVDQASNHVFISISGTCDYNWTGLTLLNGFSFLVIFLFLFWVVR